MSTETLYATSHLTGNCTSPDEALGTTDGTYTADTLDADWTSRWAMGTPTGGLLSTTQTVDIIAQKSATGGGDPTWTMTLYRNGSSVATIGSGTLSTDTGTLTGTFNGSALLDENFVQIELAVTGAGGGPNRRTIQIDEIKWTADVDTTQAITPAAATLTLTAGTTTVTAGAVNVTPAAASLTLGAGSVTVDQGETQAITPAAAGLTLTAGSVTVSTGAVAVTPAAASLTLTAGSLAIVDPDLFPASISGHKLLNPSGQVILGHTMSSWALYRLTRTNITTALGDVAAAGFNGVTVWFGGGYDLGGSWSNPYQNGDGENIWSGTEWQSTFGTGWDTYDHIVDECLRLGLTVHLSIGVAFGATGAQAEIEAATDAQMVTVGEAMANRYPVASYPNVVWHVMFDDNNTTGSTIGSRIDSYFEGIDNIESTARPVRWVENAQGQSTDESGWYLTGFSQFSINCEYDYGDNAADIIDAALASVDGSPNAVAPYGDCEPPYVGAPHYGGDEGQQLRERTYSVYFRGGCLLNFGHEAWWHFGEGGIYTPSVAQGQSWDEVFDGTRVEMTRQGYAMAFIDQWCRTSDFQATSSFVTTGEGTGDTRAAQGASGTVALAYFPDSRTIQVDTTILTGSGNVRLRWYDPTDDSYTSIAASEAQQTGRSVTHPGNTSNSDSLGDWVLVVDLLAQPITPAAATLTLTAGTATITSNVDVTPTAATLTLTAGSVTVSNWLTFADGVSASTGATVTGLANGVAYEFRVAAVNGEGQGDWSNIAGPYTPTSSAQNVTPTAASLTLTAGTTTVTTGAVAVTPAAAGLTLAAGTTTVTAGTAAVTPTAATLTLTAGSATVSNWITFADGVSATPGATVTGLANGVAYEFRVAAVNGEGQGDWSNIAGPYTPTSSAQNVTPTAATLTLTAGTVTVTQGLTLVPDPATLTLTAGTATVATGATTITPVAASLTLTAGTATVAVGAVDVTPAAAGLTLTAGSVTVFGDQVITPAAATLTLTAGSTTVTQGLTLVPDPATLTLTAGTATITTGSTQIAPTAAALTLTAGTATITSVVAVTPDSATLTLTAGTVTIEPGAAPITADTATLTVTAGTLIVGNTQTLTPTAAQLSLTAGTATVVVGGLPATVTLAVTAATVALTLQAASTSLTVTADAATAALTLQAASTSLTVAASTVALAVTDDD